MVEATSCTFNQRIIFIEVEEDYITEAYTFVFMFTDEFCEQWTEGSSCPYGDCTEFSFTLSVLYFCYDFIGNLFYTFFNCFKDIGRDFFQSCKDRTFYGVSRTIVAWGNAVQ